MTFYPQIDLGDYAGPRDGSPGHIRAIADSVRSRQAAASPYADMVIVEAPGFKVIASRGFARMNYGAGYTVRPPTVDEILAYEAGDDVVAADLQRMGTTE